MDKILAADLGWVAVPVQPDQLDRGLSFFIELLGYAKNEDQSSFRVRVCEESENGPRFSLIEQEMRISPLPSLCLRFTCADVQKAMEMMEEWAIEQGVSFRVRGVSDRAKAVIEMFDVFPFVIEFVARD